MLISFIALPALFLGFITTQNENISNMSDPYVSSVYYEDKNKNNNLEFKVFQKRIEAWKGDKNKLKIWTEDSDIQKIDKVLLFDYDGDGKKELVVLFWRYGDFVGKRSYLSAIRGDQIGQHINIYTLRPQIRLTWGGSTMSKPITDFHVCDFDLCATESSYEEFPNGNRDIRIGWKGWWWEVQTDTIKEKNK